MPAQGDWSKIVSDMDQTHLDRLDSDTRHKWLMQWGIKCKCRKCKAEETRYKKDGQK